MGRQLYVSFSLSVHALRCGDLLDFVVAVKRWKAVEHQGSQLSVNRAGLFSELRGRQLLIRVVKNNKGLHEVLAWHEAPEDR